MSAEQFSDESSRAVDAATGRLIADLQAYATSVRDMTGRTSDILTLIEANGSIEETVRQWVEAVQEHTGMTALPLEDYDVEEDDDEYDEDFDDEYDEDPELAGSVMPAQRFSVVSRFDVTVEDPDNLIAAGRRAHLVLNELDREDDAELAIDEPVAALRALVASSGFPRWDIQGLEPVYGAVLYIEPTDEPTEIDPDDNPIGAVAPPDGPIVFQEFYVSM